MVVAVINKNMLYKVFLSDSPDGDYQIRDYFNEVIGNLVYVENKLQFNANHNYEVYTDKGVVSSYFVSIGSVFKIKNLISQEVITIYIYSSNVDNAIEIKPKKNKIMVGKASDCDIIYNSPELKNHSYSLTYDKGMWFLDSIDEYVYINDRLVKRKRVDHGDVIFVGGLKVFCLGDTIVVSSLLTSCTVQLNNGVFDKKAPISQEIHKGSLELEDDKEVFGEDKFQRSPRFRSILKEKDIEFASPPNVNPPKAMPAILTLGPQLTMFITSGFTMFSSLSSVFSGQSTFAQVMPSILMSLIMTISGLLWPTLTRKYQKKENAKMRLYNTKNYRKYLVTKEKEINEIISEQKQILIENNVSLEECQQIIFRRKRNLWEKTLFDDDFLTVRVGTGLIPPRINFKYDAKGFGTDESALQMELHDLIKRVSYVDDVPVNTSLVQNRITAVIGNPGDLRLFMESILLQIATFHLYSELKIIVFSDNTHIHDWDYLKYLPHCWDNSHTTRFICKTIDEKKRVSSFIENVIKERKEQLKDKGEDDGATYVNFLPYFLVITDNINDAKQYEGINQILNAPVNLGFSLLIKNNRIANLPSQCSTFINIDKENSGLFKNDLDENNQLHFTAELNTTINVEDCFRELANIYVDVPLDKHELPKSVGFLAMYDVGNVEQLNSADRWVQNNPVNSLNVPVGIDQSGNLFNFDIHEKAYGPHGLVAGTTGSGKSEWLITYILSLCVNFSPEEVQFVLIDYKGGGLAGSFDNKETGMHLPHLVGTITNLDKSEIRRSLASLEAESKRRQRMFNEAREKLNDSSMNIYKYQQYYRKGMLDEPLSHLFIISDEFAELKAQEPEFLDQLVSIARIGRSLGIHLILATQKPAGVVDEQIKSNSKFKICLRVQDKADSKDMINVDDAAYLHQTGAFYMLVGLDEVFTLGQSAYAGGLYKPTQIVKKEVDTSVTILGQTGEEIDKADLTFVDTNNQVNQDVHGEELLNIILYVSNISNQKTMKIRKLWLEAIPEIIYVDNLKKKYNTTRTPFVINPIIGEYDNPFEQTQSVLQLELNKGNTFITGVSGSGKEQLLQTMIYSIITTFTPQEVNIYICDFGAETLAMFKDSPHVGSVTYMSEVEKIKNTFRFARKIFAERKRKYREFGGSYEAHIKYSKEKDPIMLFIINSIENLKENLEEEFDGLNSLYKECAKYGIVFVATSVEQAVFRGKVMEAFPQVLTTKIANDDYANVLGSAAKGVIPKNLKGRGLLAINKVIYEYQTASIYEPDKLQAIIKNVNMTLNNYYKIKAIPLPMIPSSITINHIPMDKVSLNNICVGYGKASIEPIYMDLQANFGTLILAPKKFNLSEYCKTFYSELDTLVTETNKVYLFDANESMKGVRFKNITYVDSSEVKNTFNNLKIYVNQEYEKYSSMEDKSSYNPAKRSIIVFHETAACFNLIGDATDDFSEMVDKIRELHLFDFIIADISADYKEVSRDKGLVKTLMDSHGILIGNTYDQQMYVDLNSRDIRQKEALPENEGYVVKNGNGFLSQVLEYTEKEDSDEI